MLVEAYTVTVYCVSALRDGMVKDVVVTATDVDAPPLVAAHSTLQRSLPLFIRKCKSKLIFHYTRVISPNRITNTGAHLHVIGIAPERHKSKETPQCWRRCSGLTSSGIDPKTSNADSDVVILLR